MHARGMVLTVAQRVRDNLLLSAGLARYGMRGSFGQGYTNVDFAQRTGFAGVQLATGPHLTSLLSLRRTTVSGRCCSAALSRRS